METKRQSEVKYIIRELCEEVKRIYDLPGVMPSTSLSAYLISARHALMMAESSTMEYREEQEEMEKQIQSWNK